MCKLTLIDVDYGVTEVNYELVKDLLVLNELSGNPDGIGYNLFHRNDIVKTKDKARDYFRKHFGDFQRNTSINGIYHVRKASTTYNNKNLDTIVRDEFTHPFIFDNIIVSHNGTLRDRANHIDYTEMQKLWKPEFIDSQKFAKTLATFSRESEEKIVSLDTINKAVNLFGGAFCFLIRDLKERNKIWVVRGRDRELHALVLSKGKKKVGIIINTGFMELLFITEKLLMYNYEYIELDKETAYTYDLQTFELTKVGKVEQDQAFTRKATKEIDTRNAWEKYNSETNWYSSAVSLYKNFLDLMFTNGLFLSEMIQFSLIFHGKSLFALDEDEFKSLTAFLKYLIDNEVYKGRVKEWLELVGKLKNDARLSVYRKTGLQFPYFLNSRGEIKKASKKIDKENNKTIINVKNIDSSTEGLVQ